MIFGKNPSALTGYGRLARRNHANGTIPIITTYRSSRSGPEPYAEKAESCAALGVVKMLASAAVLNQRATTCVFSNSNSVLTFGKILAARSRTDGRNIASAVPTPIFAKGKNVVQHCSNLPRLKSFRMAQNKHFNKGSSDVFVISYCQRLAKCCQLYSCSH